MRKDFSWKKSARTYMKMYSDICGFGTDPNVTFEDAFEALKIVYSDTKENREDFLEMQPEDYQTVVQVHIEGPGDGTFYLKFTRDGMEMEPYSYEGADVRISTTFDNLYNIAIGTTGTSRLFVNGQLKIEGNISKAFELRYLIGVHNRKKKK